MVTVFKINPFGWWITARILRKIANFKPKTLFFLRKETLTMKCYLALCIQ